MTREREGEREMNEISVREDKDRHVEVKRERYRKEVSKKEG